MHKVRGNYSSCTCRSSKNICSSSGGAQEKGKRGSKHDETQFTTKNGGILKFTLASPPFHNLNANVLFDRFVFDLTRFWTKLKVLVLCFPDFTWKTLLCKKYIHDTIVGLQLTQLLGQ
jgi:hypothetical protein